MATEENPLLSLSAEKQRQLANLVENGDIDSISEQTGLSRRQVLGIGGALLASAGVGGVTADQIIQEVQADASTTDSDGNVGLPGDRVDVYADGVDSNSLSTEQAEVTNETLVITGPTSFQTGLSSGTWHTINFDAAPKDELGEVSTSQNEFVPAETGYYHVLASAMVGSVNDGDQLFFKLINTNSGTDRTIVQESTGTANRYSLNLSRVIELSGGESYQLQIRNGNSSFDLVADNQLTSTFLTVRRAFR